MKIEIFLIIIIGCCFSHQTSAKCPSAEVILPCRCEDNVNIYCGGNSYYDLRNVFVSLSSSALTEEDKHFKQFYFNNTAIDELVSDVFYDITFDTIQIDCAYNLTKINTNAFASTNYYVTEFLLWNTPYGNASVENNIFNAINAMINIDRISITNTSLTAIPSNAFIALNKLRELIIANNPNLESLGDYAFYDLSHLTLLSLIGNPITDTFPVNAFSFRNRNANNNTTLHIYLNAMPNLVIDSFSVGMFTTINRPFVLCLNWLPQLKYLPKNLFDTVLSGGNRIELVGTQLECDCRMYWLYENRAVYESLVRNPKCTDGESVFAEREIYLHCNVQY